LSVQHFSDNDYSIGGALVGGLGGGARLTINEHLMSEATIIFHSGRLNISAGSAGLFGIQIRGGVQYTL
jgi:hypothetical protein